MTGSNGLYTIEDLFRAMASDVKEFAGLSLSKIGDLGVQVVQEAEKKNVPTAGEEAKTGALPTPA